MSWRSGLEELGKNDLANSIYKHAHEHYFVEADPLLLPRRREQSDPIHFTEQLIVCFGGDSNTTRTMAKLSLHLTNQIANVCGGRDFHCILIPPGTPRTG